MSYRLIRNAAVKSCTAKIFGIGCFTKSYDCCLCQNFTELHQFAFFAMFQSRRGENPFSLMTEEHCNAAMQEYSGSVNNPPACSCSKLNNAGVAANQNKMLHLRKQLHSQKEQNGWIWEKSVSPRAFIILIHVNQHQSESVICDDKNQYWSRDGGRLISCSEADYQVINDPNGAFGTFRTTSLSKLSKSYQTWSEHPHHLKL